MHTPSIAMRGYDIRFRTSDSSWMNQKVHGYAVLGQLPAEWSNVTSNPDVLEAVCFLSSEARKQSQKRKLAASYYAA